MARAQPACEAAVTAAQGLRVSERLSGFLAPADSHEDGYRRGRREGARAAYRAAIVIPDLDVFLADPEHLATLEGTVEIAGVASGQTLEGATIRLFCRREGRKRILYDLPFTGDDGHPYTLRGEKRIDDDPGLDVWKDMTTLYAHLVALHGGDEQVAARGILRVSPATALGMAFTFGAAGRGSKLGTVRAGLRFLLFCRAELNETYRKFLVPW